ncbi:phage/plasmid primase, P4 family [Kaistia geumhonensis]|uniref:DNA primase/helicase n=1 Tax=Kaistia geumhonensis TaxID=410839 RepID=A0ABU0M663_9HYPH|nr:DNA primase family protein [Kaistia geumhonensis]MCX5478467.1 phage/plasmid primase, P4 family [Kaistia geumhonensis]MDQ0516315.1 putative DNA primase/helicase [Kaistia geumhonensis]
MLDDPRRQIADAIAHAQPIGPEPPSSEGGDFDAGDGPAPFGDYDGDENGPSDLPPDGSVDPNLVAECAPLDHSDTDNGLRLRKHFGRDLVVMEQAGAKVPAFVAWTGTHWDVDTGGPAAMRIAQKIGALIALEADHLTATPDEIKAMRRGADAEDELDTLEAKESPTDAEKQRIRLLRALVDDGEAAKAELKKRQIARRKFGVSSKNKARLEAMLACAAPHMLIEPEAFNANHLLVATAECTLAFDRISDPECPDPDVTRWLGRCTPIPGHRREDMITKVLPIVYDPAATCPRFDAFLDEFQPDAATRRMLQTWCGLGLLGLTSQHIVFHYGLGANGKSVFMETIMRVMGDLAVGLPAESITGDGARGAGAASPDLARLYGVRCLRVLELAADQPLQEALVKKLTGGERIPVRTLFQGYFEFTPIFTGHMSGNGYPRIDGTDNGIWRRMLVVHWPVTIAEERRENFEDVLARFAPEYAGILNWMIEGAKRYMAEGLVIPEAVKLATKEYRDEMDPIGLFVGDCVSPAAGESVTAREMYQAYVAWSEANAKKAFFETKFGRVMKTRFRRSEGSPRRYLDCRLHDVPATAPRSPSPEDYEP